MTLRLCALHRVGKLQTVLTGNCKDAKAKLHNPYAPFPLNSTKYISIRVFIDTINALNYKLLATHHMFVISMAAMRLLAELAKKIIH